MVEYLSGGRIQGTDSTTRLLNLFADIKDDLSSDTNDRPVVDSGTTPIYGQSSMRWTDNPASGTDNAYMGGIGNVAKTTGKDLPAEDFSIAVWIRYNTAQGSGGGSSDTGDGFIIGNANPRTNSLDSNNCFGIAIHGGTDERFRIMLAGGEGSDENAFGTGGDETTNGLSAANVCLKDDDWHHYVFLFSNTLNTNGGLKIYRDGSLADTLNYNVQIDDLSSTSGLNCDLGRNAQDNGSVLKEVWLNDLSILGRLLTTDEISDLYGTHVSGTTSTALLTGKNVVDSGIDTSMCYAWWKMNAIFAGGSGFIPDSIASSQVPITDVPTGTRLEVTDTRKIYRYASAKSFTDDQTTDKGWASDSGSNSVNTSTNQIVINHQDPIWISTGVDMLASENFMLDFEVNFDTISGSARQDALLFGSASNQKYGANPTDNSWYIILKVNNNPSGFAISARAKNAAGSDEEINSSESSTPSADTWYWYRFIRNGDVITTTRHTTEANRTNGVVDATCTTTFDSALKAVWTDSHVIKYLCFGGYASYGADYDVRNITFYRGLTSPTDYKWAERGTA